MKKIIIIIPLFFILLLIRILFNNSERLVLLIASINWVSILAIVACIFDKIINGIVETLNTRPKSIAKRTLKKVKIKIILITIILFIVSVSLYYWKLCSQLGNDILAIIALALSILDEEISNFFINKFKDKE